MVVRVVAVGRLKDPAIREACDKYIARIRRRQKFDIVEVRDAGRSDRSAAAARQREGERILAALPPTVRCWALTRTGTRLDSDGFARRLAQWRHGARDVALIVGGAHGIHQRVFERCEGRLSLSSLTLPHELARLVLLEQVYRADAILQGTPYHKPSA